MPIFVVSYDLNKQKDYPKLWAELEKLGCVRALDSVWLGSLTGTSESVRDHFTKFVDTDDSILVAQTTKAQIKLKRPYTKAIEWLKS